MEFGSIGRPTFGGLASGLDTNALLSGLLDIERQPLLRIQSQRDEVASERGLMQDLNRRIAALRDAARDIDNRTATGSENSTTEELLRYTGSSSNDSVVKVRADAGASPGDIDVQVLSRATGSRRLSTAFATRDAVALAARQSITISLPNGDPDAVPAVEDTEIVIEATEGDIQLGDLRDQINASADNGSNVRADVLQVSDDEFRLVLTSTQTGESNNLTVSGAVAIDAALDEPAQNAQVIVFGQTIERETNNIDDVLPGVTIELAGISDRADPDVELDPLDPSTYASETLTVDIDTDAVAEALETFTKAYNDVIDFIDRQFSFDEGSNSAGALSNDTTLRSVQAQLQRIVSRGFIFQANPSNPFAPSGENESGGNDLGGGISGVGIDIQDGGRLSLDRERLEEALNRDATSFVQFFRGDDRVPSDPDAPDADFYDEGFATLVVQELEGLVRGGDGILAKRDEAYQDRLDDFDRSIERFEFRLSQREESLILRFSELERIVAGLQNQQGFLNGIG